MNNPLKYTDPSGYSYKPAYWNVGTNGAFYVNQYANSGPTGLIGPGSRNHWSDPYRTKNSSWWLGNEASFDNKYGEGAYDSYYNQHYAQQTSENTISNGDVSNNNELSTAWVQVGFFYYDSNGNPIVGEDGTFGQFWVYEASVIDGSNLGDAFDIPHGGIMFYDENGLPLYVSGLGDDNIIYTVKAKNIAKFQQSLAALNPKSNPLTINDAQLLAKVYGNNSYTPLAGNRVNGTFVLGQLQMTWYIHAVAAISIMGEGFAAGHAGGRAQMMNKPGWQGLQNHYNMQSGAVGFWLNYYTPRNFKPWW